MGARVRAFDPAGMTQAGTLLKDVTYGTDPYDCAQNADALVIATEWEQFRALDLDRLRDVMACPIVIDLRNIYRPEEMHRLGFTYMCVGKPTSAPIAVEASLTSSAGSASDDEKLLSDQVGTA
jgi:UDPglucose 6-dehydrogenase